MNHSPADPRVRLVCTALALGTLLVYAPLNFHDFVNYDDQLFVTANPMVLQGLTAEGLAWAFGTAGVDYWRPLSWVSHMLDVELFDLDAGAHHAVSLLLHTANTLLLFLVLRRMTGQLWPSALVAALFAWHPLHVESVAWVAERKDVLCAFFWLLTMGAYAWYAEAPGGRRYGLVVLCFVLGLMSKPMIVTLPCALLLLDVWPLRRWRPAFWGKPPPGELARPAAALGRLVLEKLPLLVLALAVSLATFHVAHKFGSAPSLDGLPVNMRILNALGAYATYLEKMVWPTDMIIFYPYVPWRMERLVIAACLLTAISALAVWQARGHPYLLVGWLWFLGTLVPVIGLVQAGGQALADRYTYLPLIGMFIMVAWGTDDLLGAWKHRKVFTQVAALAVVTACLAVTGHQVAYWQDSHTLGTHAHTVAPCNGSAAILAPALIDRGEVRQAMTLLQEVLRPNPADRDCQLHLGHCHMLLGEHTEARRHTTAGLRQTKLPEHIASAILPYALMVERKPADPEARHDLATVLMAAGQVTNALHHFNELLRLKPDSPEAWTERGALHAQMGQTSLAAVDYATALRLDPGYGLAHARLAGWHADQGRLAEAMSHYQAAIQAHPANATNHYQKALMLIRLNRPAEAVVAYRSAIHFAPTLSAAQEGLAWLLATWPDAAHRNGPEAVRLARRATQLRDGFQSSYYDTLAAAYAENGRFAEAEVAALRAIKIAKTARQTNQMAEYQSRLELYRTRQPYRTVPLQPAPP